MLYYFKRAQHWLFDLPDNSCNTLPWRTRDVRIYIKCILINHSASIKKNERHTALLLLGYRMPPRATQSIRTCFFRSDRAHWWPVAGQWEDAPDPWERAPCCRVALAGSWRKKAEAGVTGRVLLAPRAKDERCWVCAPSTSALAEQEMLQTHLYGCSREREERMHQWFSAGHDTHTCYDPTCPFQNEVR